MWRSLLLFAGIFLGASSQAWAIGALEEEQEPALGTTSGNVTLTSDYITRGQSQTEHQPAIQGGFDWAHPTGVYVGAWGSNVHSAEVPEAALELDLYGGYTLPLGESLSLSAGALYYSFFRGEEINTWDFPLRLNWRAFKVGLSFSPRWGGQDVHVWYLSAGWSDRVVEKISLALSAGYSFVSGKADYSNYGDFRLGLSREILGVTAEVAGAFVNRRQFNGADDPRAIVSISKAF